MISKKVGIMRGRNGDGDLLEWSWRVVYDFAIFYENALTRILYVLCAVRHLEW